MGRRARSAVFVPVYFCGEFADLLLQEAQLSQNIWSLNISLSQSRSLEIVLFNRSHTVCDLSNNTISNDLD